MRWNVWAAFRNPNGMRVNSYNPLIVSVIACQRLYYNVSVCVYVCVIDWQNVIKKLGVIDRNLINLLKKWIVCE